MEICVNEKDVERDGNYLRIKISDELMCKLNSMAKLSSLKPGQTFTDAEGVEYIVLYQASGITGVLRKKLLGKDMEFGENNDWTKSGIRHYLNTEYDKHISKMFGSDNIMSHTVDLLSLDGLDDYGTVIDRVSLLTIDLYRKYRKVIGDNMDRWWWLATPDSTPSGWSARGVQGVCDFGGVSCDVCGFSGGVRPFFILNSSILVSKS